MSEKKIAVIPARGGSKRIVKKNIKAFAGKPLIAYSLDAAIASNVFDDILVSTDDDRIGRVAEEFGATVIIERPDELSDDYTGTSPVVRHAIQAYEQERGEVDYVCCIYATAPFVSAQYLQNGLKTLQSDDKFNYAFSVTTFDFPIQRAIRLSEHGVEPIDSASMAKRSQDLETCYHDAGQFYWGLKQAWLGKAAMFEKHSAPVILPRHLVQDIDTEEDWLRAELMYKAYVRT